MNISWPVLDSYFFSIFARSSINLVVNFLYKYMHLIHKKANPFVKNAWPPAPGVCIEPGGQYQVLPLSWDPIGPLRIQCNMPSYMFWHSLFKGQYTVYLQPRICCLFISRVVLWTIQCKFMQVIQETYCQGQCVPVNTNYAITLIAYQSNIIWSSLW